MWGLLTQKLCLIIPIITLVLAMAACSPRTLVVRELVNMVEEGLPAIEQEDDLNLLAHAMPAHIKLLETFLAGEPHNEKLLVLLARLYGGYAFAILESELEAQHLGRPAAVKSGIAQESLADAVARYYQTGAHYALRGLECRYPKAGLQLNQLMSAQAFIQSMDKTDVPALFWYGFNLGGFVQHRLDSVEALAKAHLVEKTMTRVVALDETYYHGNAYLALMVYHAARSPMMGGNPEKARKYFARHRQMNTGTASLGDVYWSRYILVRQQEKEAFVKRLSAIGKRPDRSGALSLVDRVAIVRAQLYLESVDHFFD